VVALFAEPVVFNEAVVKKQVEIVSTNVLVKLLRKLVLIICKHCEIRVILYINFRGLNLVVVCVKQILYLLLSALQLLLIYKLLIWVVSLHPKRVYVFSRVLHIHTIVGRYFN
jgi:hypothetical protein